MIRIQRSRRHRNPPGVIDVTRRGRHGVPVGTPDYWGNPFEVDKDGNRTEVIALFRRDVEQLSPDARAAWLAPLRQAAAIMCWCSPDVACHGDVLIEYLEKTAP